MEVSRLVGVGVSQISYQQLNFDDVILSYKNNALTGLTTEPHGLNTNDIIELFDTSIEYKSSALLDDVIKLKTFVIKSEGVISTRVVEMYHEDTEKLIARSETNWCFMNNQTKKPSRITPEIIDLFN